MFLYIQLFLKEFSKPEHTSKNGFLKYLSEIQILPQTKVFCCERLK